MLVILTGLIAGFVHVISGPDHLAAISPISVESKKSGWLIGFRWGLGHTGGVFIVAVIALLFRELIPMDIISSYSERLVGIILIAIGAWGLQKIFSVKLHVHEHIHGGHKHFHFHHHFNRIPHQKKEAHFHTHAALIVGIVHGLAGSSHLLGILPALALPAEIDAVIYLIAFGTGTIAAMMIFSESIGRIARKFESIGELLYLRLSISFSSIAILIGIFWIVK